MVGTVLVFEGQGAREVPGDPPVDLTALAPVAAQTAIVEHQVARAAASGGDGPIAVLGQSLGEIAALVVAGSLSLETARTLVALRAGLPDELLEPRDWTMVSHTRLRPDQARVAAADLPLWVIGENAPADCVVVGTAEAFGTFADRLALKRATYRHLPVVHPYHTPLMQPVAEAMAEALPDLDVRDPEVPVRSPTGPRWVTDADGARAVLVDALTAPVAWSAALSAAAAEWPDARFRECGPSASLHRFVWKHQLTLDWAEA